MKKNRQRQKTRIKLTVRADKVIVVPESQSPRGTRMPVGRVVEPITGAGPDGRRNAILRAVKSALDEPTSA